MKYTNLGENFIGQMNLVFIISTIDVLMAVSHKNELKSRQGKKRKKGHLPHKKIICLIIP